MPLCLISASAASKARARLRRPVAVQPLPDRQQRCTPDLPDPDRKIALDEKRFERRVQQSRRIVGPRPRLVVFLGSAHDLAKLFEHEIGDGHVLAALDGALELPHQQRLRLGRELGEIVPQPLGRCLAHSPGVDMRVMGRAKHPSPILEVRALRSRLGITKSIPDIAGSCPVNPR